MPKSNFGHTKFFRDLNKTNADIAGGKGASLGEMSNAGISVPDGFVVLSSAFEEFVRVTGLSGKIDSILKRIDPDSSLEVNGASEKIRSLIKRAQMPADIAAEIIFQYKALDTEFVAVRSSASAEDGETDAWAGQLETYLNASQSRLLEKVQNCWASLFTPRAISYGFEKKIHIANISVAVVIQDMVNSEKSGTAFSAHPVTGDKNQIVIEATCGLGEAVVSGVVTPDRYIVEKEPRRIGSIDVSPQKRAFYPREAGGSEWIELDEMRELQALNDDRIIELSGIVMQIESHFGFPCDIEWAFQNGKFHILQSRPITALQENNLLSELRAYLNRQVMDDRGKRPSSIFMAKVKILAWTKGMAQEIGAGYKTALINSLGEQFVDRDNRKAVRDALEGWGIDEVREYMGKMGELDATLRQKVRFTAQTDLMDEFARLVAFFFIIRDVIEPLYGQLDENDRSSIDSWRNNPDLFSSLDLYDGTHQEMEGIARWSVVMKEGELLFLPEIIQISEEKSPSAGSDVIRGVTAYGGRILGRARVVRSRKDRDSVKDGEIIVAPMTTVDFAAAMTKAAAFVTDEGGITSHAAIVARELRKPCVINTKIGTDVIKTGDMIEVNADDATVRILREQE